MQSLLLLLDEIMPHFMYNYWKDKKGMGGLPLVWIATISGYNKNGQTILGQLSLGDAMMGY